MKVFFKDQNIDREGSFLNYFDVHLHKFIAEPYREDVTAEVFLKEEGPSKWHVFDKVTYRCRRAAGTIQRDVKWVEDPGELDVKALKLEITYPADHLEKPSHKAVLADTTANDKMFETFRTGVSLNDYADVDGLVVSLEATYVVTREKFQYWTMAHPTKNFDFTIKYPTGFTIQRKSFVINEGQMMVTENDGYLRAKYDSWLLPAGGIAWRVCSPLVSATGGSGPTAEANS